MEEEKSPFISTGFIDLDNKIGGLESEGITVVGACPAMGKTAWLMSLISYYIQEKTNQQNQKIKPIFIFSLEMDAQSLMTLGTNHSENRAVELSAISRELKIQAKDFSIPLWLLAQLNRSPDSRPDKRPIMSDFKESGAIEQDATNVILLYREEVCNENSDSKGIGEFIIAKAVMHL